MDGLNPSRAAAPLYGVRRARRTGPQRGRKQRAFVLNDLEEEHGSETQEDHETGDDRGARPEANAPRRPDPDEETGRRLDVTA